MIWLKALFGGIIPVWFWPAVIAVALGAMTGAAYYKGYSRASSLCKSDELQRVIEEQAEALKRYKTAVEATKEQLAVEVKTAAETESLLVARVKELEAEGTVKDAAEAALEEALTAAISDKVKRDAIIKQIRAARFNCAATDSDIKLDDRMRR